MKNEGNSGKKVGMDYESNERGNLRFTLFGIPTSIQPSAWIALVVLGALFSGTRVEISVVLIFVAAGMLCLLMHEYGHALAARAAGIRDISIYIYAAGGVTMVYPRPHQPRQLALFYLAGPAGSLLMGVLAGVVMGVHIGQIGAGVKFCLYEPFHALVATSSSQPQEWQIPIYVALLSGKLSAIALQVYYIMAGVSMWWTAFNLLPIYPLDGGQMLMLGMRNRRHAHSVCLGVAGILLLWSVASLHFYTAFICAALFYDNWQHLKKS